jgi:hypothetical protein
VITGVMSSSKHAEAEKLCPEGQCPEGGDGAEAAGAFRSLRTVSTVSYAVGAAGLVTGVVLLLTGSGSGSGEQLSASVEPWGSGYRFGVSGSF